MKRRRKELFRKMKKAILAIKRKRRKVIFKKMIKRGKTNQKTRKKSEKFIKIRHSPVQEKMVKQVGKKRALNEDYQKSLKVKTEEEKFFTPTPEYAPLKEDLPSRYNKDTLVLMVRDPWWVFCYWELTPQKITQVRKELSQEKFYFVLRVYEITNIIFTGSNAHYYFDIPINLEARNWYINLPAEGKSWIVDLGVKGDFGFKTVLRSNSVNCPQARPSEILDEEWMIPEEEFLKLYAASIGFRGTSPGAKEIFEKRLLQEFPSGGFSPGFFSGDFFLRERFRKRERKFFLEVWTELIVYGRTEPNAKVYIRKEPIRLKDDGTFSVRFFLPDGRQVIDVKAISADNTQERKVVSVVSKETR